MTTPYGVDGCRCDQGFTWDDREEIWHANPTCPYHGILPRNRTDTGVYRVVTNSITGEPRECSCLDADCEKCFPPPPPHDCDTAGCTDSLNDRLRKGIEQARRGETIDRGDFTHDDTPCGPCWRDGEQHADLPCQCTDTTGLVDPDADDGSPPCDHCHNFGHSFEDCPHAYCDPDKGEHVDHTLDEPFARLMDVHNGGCNHQSCDHVWDPRDGRIKTHEEARRDDGIPDTDAWHRVDGLIHDGAAVDCRDTRCWFAEERRRRDATVSDAATRTANISAGLNARLAPVDDGGTDNHLCITPDVDEKAIGFTGVPSPDTYYCPTSGETESACHGGFDTCCDRPDLHVTGADTCRPPCPRHCPPTPTSASRRPWWKRLRIRLRWVKEVLFDDVD